MMNAKAAETELNTNALTTEANVMLETKILVSVVKLFLPVLNFLY